jgi:uncharacterized protein (TIGR02147 family)
MNTILETSDWREILKDSYAQLRRRNPRYSMRAFARQTGVSASSLCEVMKGKHGISRGSAQRFAESLGFSPTESEYFCDLVDADTARSPDQRHVATVRLRKYEGLTASKRLEDETFRFMSQWYHVAILELTMLKTFSWDHQWIADRLGIFSFEVAEAIQRMEKLGILKPEGNGWKYALGNFETGDQVASAAVRRFQKQILQLADRGLGQAREKRVYSALTLAISKEQFLWIKEKLAAMKEEVTAAVTANNGVKDRLYMLSCQLFELKDQRLN